MHNRSLSLTTPARELEIYKLDLECVWGGGDNIGMVRAEDCILVLVMKENHQLGTESCCAPQINISS
jgi:hypothetical protein